MLSKNSKKWEKVKGQIGQMQNKINQRKMLNMDERKRLTLPFILKLIIFS